MRALKAKVSEILRDLEHDVNRAADSAQVPALVEHAASRLELLGPAGAGHAVALRAFAL